MIEKTIIDYLAQEVVQAYGEEPENPPAQYLVIEKTGSGTLEGSAGLIPTATVAVKSNAETLAAAGALNEQVKAAMAAIANLPTVVKCTLNSDYPYTNTATKRRRYQAVFDLVYYS